MVAPKRTYWTHEELQALIPDIEKKLSDIEATEEEEIKPLPPLTKEECQKYMFNLVEVAQYRLLTKRECFIHGQLMVCLEHAIRAEMLGKKKGRYFVVSEEDLNQIKGKIS